jgi:5-methyltetrahydropteroyltriglutamate--homocysteine methyltransferase
MKRSTDRILTTHVGSLPFLPGVDHSTFDDDAKLRQATLDVVRRQREAGIDIVNEGEYTKGGDWLSFIETRFGGFEERERPADQPPLITWGKDREEFAEFYEYATKQGTLFFAPGEQIATRRPWWVCAAPLTYTGQDELAREIALLKEAAGDEEVFLTSTAPASLEVYRRNDYYKTDEEYLYAFADALREEYVAIAESGVILQIDDAWLPALWDRIGIQMGMDAFRKYCELRTEALNHAIRGIPEDRIRYHLCWGSWHGPHAYDLELKSIVDIMLKVTAQAYLIEGANVRHEHEWELWRDVKLPEGKILMPGVVTHSTDLIEHPGLVSQRIQRYASVVGKENVIAGADCGFGGRSHPQIAWAKLQALSEGAALASKALWGR